MSERKFKRDKQKFSAGRLQKEPQEPYQPMVQAMVWYREEHWQTLREMFEDSDLLPLTYADWLQRAEELKAKVQESGDIAIKVFIDPETFPKWCEEKGLPMNAEARTRLAIEVAQAQSFSL